MSYQCSTSPYYAFPTSPQLNSTSASASDKSPYQPGSQLALPRLTGNLPLYVTMWTRHVDSSCDLALPGNSSFGLVMWTRHLAARPEINPYQPLLNQLRFPPTSQWVSSRRAPFEPVSSLPTFPLAMPPNSSLPSQAPT